MKKFKKILAAVSAAVLCTMPMANSFSTCATFNDYKTTYRVYADLKPASGMQRCTIDMNVLKYTMKPGDFVLGNVNASLFETGSSGGLYGTLMRYTKVFTAEGDVTNGGTLFRMNYYTKLDSQSFYDNMSILVSCTNSAGNSIDPIPVDITVVMVGDADQNGVVDFNDSIMINNYLMGKATLTDNAIRSADVNNDGFITLEDSNMILSYLSGQIEHFCNI